MGSPLFADPDAALRFVRSIDSPYTPFSIFPSEMAYFLYACDHADIACIIESGRFHGYSTGILGAYGEASGARIVSIDYELLPATGERLSRYGRLELLTGDSFQVLPRLLLSERRRIALLIDGPKRDVATDLSAAACAIGTVAVVAHHNMYGEAVVARFAKHFPNARYLEQTEMFTCEGFRAFREWERTLPQGPHRDLDRTSLLVSVLPSAGPDARYIQGVTPQQTRSVRQILWWWKMGVPRPTWVAGAARRKLRLGRRLRQVFTARSRSEPQQGGG